VTAEIRPPFDPRELIGALERGYVTYVVIGAVARVLHGTDEVTDGLDICPNRRDENIGRLAQAIAVINGGEALDPAVRDRLASEEITTLATRYGELRVVPVPAGTRGGYEDLRWHANRDAIGDGLRPSVACVEDLLRMSTALGRETDAVTQLQLRRLLEIERTLGLEL
jgi:hypothetical protein